MDTPDKKGRELDDANADAAELSLREDDLEDVAGGRLPCTPDEPLLLPPDDTSIPLGPVL